MPRKRSVLTIVLLLATFVCLFCFPIVQVKQSTANLSPANSTLDFGTILAVSHLRSPRRPSLLWATNLADLHIDIPEQPERTPSDVSHFKAKEESKISTGSAEAWLGHLHALECFLNTEHETALIMEDDTDFDISIRQSQIPSLAAAIRSVLNGHCDDFISPSAYLGQPHMAYRDPTVPAVQQMHPDTSLLLHSLNIPSQTRFLHRAYWPFCTFAYAINRRSESLILSTMSREPEGGTSAYDVALLTACRDRDWKCWSVAPELFHHSRGMSEIGKTDTEIDIAEESGRGEKEGVRTSSRGTWNLRCGARHAQLWVGEEDVDGRNNVKRTVQKVLARGRSECPIDALGEESSWKGCEWGECGSQS